MPFHMLSWWSHLPVLLAFLCLLPFSYMRLRPHTSSSGGLRVWLLLFPWMVLAEAADSLERAMIAVVSCCSAREV
jgi:hypothetical protein